MNRLGFDYHPLNENILAKSSLIMDIKIPYTLKHQAYIHKQIDKHRWNVLVCHRRFGKTVAVLNHLIRSALTSKNKNPGMPIYHPPSNNQKLLLGII